MLKNIGSNWTLNVVQILVFMVLARFTLDALGAETFGVWEAVVAASGPLQLLILGLPMATVRSVSAELARDDKTAAEHALGTSVTLTLVLGGCALVVGALVWAGFDAVLLGNDEWQLGAAGVADGRRAIAIVLVNLALGFALRLPYALYDAHHDFVVRNLIMALGFFLKLGLTVALLSVSASLTALATAQLLVALLEFTVAYGVSRQRHGVRFRPAKLEYARAKEILSFSVFAFLLNMGALFAFQVDALVIGANMTSGDVAVYGMGNKIFDPMVNLLLAIGMVVMPMATSLQARGALDEVRDIFLKWSKIATSMVLMLGAYLMVLGPEFLAWWLGPEYRPEAGRLMRVLMVSFFFFLPIRGVALPVLMGIGRPRGPAFGLLAMGLANLGLSLWLVRQHGVLGVALGTAVPNVLFASAFLGVACAELGLPVREYVGYVLGRALPGLVLPLGFLLLVRALLEPTSFLALFATGVTFVALFGAAQVLFVFRGDRYADLYAILLGKLRTRGAA